MTKKVITIQCPQFEVDYVPVQELIEKIKKKEDFLVGQGCKRGYIMIETQDCSRGYMYLHSNRLETDEEYQERLLKEEALEAMRQLNEHEKDKRNLDKLEAELVALQERINKAKGL